MSWFDREDDRRHRAESTPSATDVSENVEGADTRFSVLGTLPGVTGDDPAERPSASELAFGTLASLGDAARRAYLKTRGAEEPEKGGPLPSKHTGSDEEAKAAGRPPTPPDFKGLDPDLIDKLWTSRHELNITNKDWPEDKFWESMRTYKPVDIHAFVQLTREAKKAGLWDCIDKLLGVYASPGSHGIKFKAHGTPPMAEGAWGRDLQEAVRAEHGDKGAHKHDWYRQNTGAGNPGLHLGVDSGAGDNDLHIDPTNPMKAVGTGQPQFIDGSVVIAPKGQAIYDLGTPLLQHEFDIGKLGKGAQKAFGKKPSNLKMLEMSQWNHFKYSTTARELGQRERGDSHVKDRARAEAAASALDAAAAKLPALVTRIQALAVSDDIPAIAEAYADFEALRDETLRALANLVEHLHAEVPNADVKGFNKFATWSFHPVPQSGTMDAGFAVIEALQQQRAKS